MTKAEYKKKKALKDKCRQERNSAKGKVKKKGLQSNDSVMIPGYNCSWMKAVLKMLYVKKIRRY